MDRSIALLPAAFLLGGCASQVTSPWAAYDSEARSRTAVSAAYAPQAAYGPQVAEVTEIDIQDFGYQTVCDSATPTGSRISRGGDCHVADRPSGDDSVDRQLVRERIEHLRREQLSIDRPSSVGNEAALQRAVLEAD